MGRQQAQMKAQMQAAQQQQAMLRQQQYAQQQQMRAMQQMQQQQMRAMQQPQVRQFAVQVPQGTSPGQRLQIQNPYNGQMLMVNPCWGFPWATIRRAVLVLVLGWPIGEFYLRGELELDQGLCSRRVLP